MSASRALNDPTIQPKAFAFDAASEVEIETILARYPAAKKASAVIPLLYVVQAQMKRETDSGWVPKLAMDAIARRLSMPPVRVYEVASFYTMFNLRPIGRVHLQACTTTPCWLRGSDEVVAACKRATGISAFGETSADGMFTLTEVECVGACVNAPVLVVDDDFYEDLDGARTEALIAALRRGERPARGSSTGRQNSAPEGGANTLLEGARS
jgi:NADH-quinone oxidoreductase subunit E